MCFYLWTRNRAWSDTGVLRAPNTENVCTHNDVMEMCVSAPNIALSLQNENGNQKLALALGV